MEDQKFTKIYPNISKGSQKENKSKKKVTTSKKKSYSIS